MGSNIEPTAPAPHQQKHSPQQHVLTSKEEMDTIHWDKSASAYTCSIIYIDIHYCHRTIIRQFGQFIFNREKNYFCIFNRPDKVNYAGLLISVRGLMDFTRRLIQGYIVLDEGLNVCHLNMKRICLCAPVSVSYQEGQHTLHGSSCWVEYLPFTRR